MGRKNKASDGTEILDGELVSRYTAKLQGTFDADEINSENLSYDDHVCLIVMARVGAAKFTSNKDAELTRENGLKVLRAVQISPELAEKTLESHRNGSGQQALTTVVNNVTSYHNTADDVDDVYDDDEVSILNQQVDDTGEVYKSFTPRSDQELANFLRPGS
jgi:hypothetical protein